MFRRCWYHIVFESSWLFLAILGILSASLAWCQDELVSVLAAGHELFTNLVEGVFAQTLLYTLYMLFFVLIAVALTQTIAPAAVGSGIPQMKSILAGYELVGYLSSNTLVAKVLGLTLAMGSGLCVGKEGPFVHTSCCVAQQLLRVPMFRELRHNRMLVDHILAAACAVGVSSTFGSPIGGVLFSIEVTSNVYVTSNYWKGFFCAVCGAITFTYLTRIDSATGNIVSLFWTEFEPLPYYTWELVMYLLLSCVCGWLGGLFVRLVRRILACKRKYSHRAIVGNPWVFAAAVVLLTGFTQYPTGTFMHKGGLRQSIDDLFHEGSLEEQSRQCPWTSKAFTSYTGADEESWMRSCLVKDSRVYVVSQYNLTGSNATKLHIDSWDNPSVFLNLILFVLFKFLLTSISITMAIPCGVFTPVFAIGAGLGRFLGELTFVLGGPAVIAGGYAVVGAAAFTAGVTGTVSIAVIIFELTSQLTYMLPVLFAVLVGRAMGAYVSTFNIYDSIGRERNLGSLPALHSQRSYSKLVRDFMVPPHAVLPRHLSREELRGILRATEGLVVADGTASATGVSTTAATGTAATAVSSAGGGLGLGSEDAMEAARPRRGSGTATGPDGPKEGVAPRRTLGAGDIILPIVEMDTPRRVGFDGGAGTGLSTGSRVGTTTGAVVNPFQTGLYVGSVTRREAVRIAEDDSLWAGAEAAHEMRGALTVTPAGGAAAAEGGRLTETELETIDVGLHDGGAGGEAAAGTAAGTAEGKARDTAQAAAGGAAAGTDLLRVVCGRPTLALSGDTNMGDAVLLLSVHRAPVLFVTDRGRLAGAVYVADLARLQHL